MKTFLRNTGLAIALTTAGWANAECSFDLVVGDYLKFSMTDMIVKKSCGTVTVNLRHEGKLAANMMGHNWVLSATGDVQPVAMEGMSAGLANHYVKPNDARVIAASNIIGGGETTSLTFETAALSSAGSYTYFCSFPGHSYGMRGTLTIVP
tara:strand:+ start:2375 stop:2827 length:453 start_codon:yes stop_codon:yes gene_type:complete